MGGYWGCDCPVRKVTCPRCGYTAKSTKFEPQCKECGARFKGNDNLYKTDDDRKKERKEIFELVAKLKKNQSDMNDEFTKAIDKITHLLKPL